ncbi:MAG: hypothetical protein EBZ77_17695 [Chitinophagia bacterium]|nr:hypothetical protein [Chitinophagia bacterium]
MRNGMSADCEMARAGSRLTMEHRRSDAALAVATSPTVALARWMIGLPIGPEGPVPMGPVPIGPMVSGPKSHGDETRKSTVGPKPGPHASEVRGAFMESKEAVESKEASLQSEQGVSDEQ